MIREGPKEAFNGCFVTCSPTERERRNRSNGDDDDYFFEKLRFFEIDVPRFVLPLSENKTNRSNNNDV